MRMAKYMPAGPPPMMLIFIVGSTLIVQAENGRPTGWQSSLSRVHFGAVFDHHFHEVFCMKKRLDYRSCVERPVLIMICFEFQASSCSDNVFKPIAEIALVY